MNETLKNKSRILGRPIVFFVWLTVSLFVAAIALTFVRDRFLRDPNDFITVSVIYVLYVLFLLSFIGFILSSIPRTRPFMAWLLGDFWFWLFTWPGLRLLLVGMAVLATLIAIFYAEEDWRGKRAWENCKRELEAKGEVLDWNNYIPPPVPDDQNFFKAPKMTDWFVKGVVNTNGIISFHSTNELAGLSTNGLTTAIITNEMVAANYLKWSDPFEPNLDLIREALKRPYARMDGDYSKPYEQPIPNFIAVRSVAQVLARRAKCYLLLGQPEKALQELTLLHDFRHLLEAAPTGKPMTLVSAMINVAVTGLYVDTIAGGLQSHAWQEPQLAALQNQLAEINLTPFVAHALREEQVGFCREAEVVEFSQIMNVQIRILVSNGPSSKISLWKKILNLESYGYDHLKSYGYDFLPRGWIYQNMVNVAVLDQKSIDAFDLAHDTVAPRKFEEAWREIDEFDESASTFRPYKFLAAIAIPNFVRAEQTTAHNQTLVNEAQVACALERYHLAHGEYPETLEALAPQFIAQIPHDIIGGQPLHYRRTDDGKFLLYSVGWNETDDGGLPGTLSDVKNGDWVWQAGK